MNTNRILSLAALALVGGALLLADAGSAQAQAGGDVYEGFADDGRLIRFILSPDATSVTLAHLADTEDAECGSGHVDRFIGQTIEGITAGHFEFDLAFNFGPEPSPFATEVTITGDLAPDGTASGTYQALRPNDPVCDTGLMSWQGMALYNVDSVGLGERTFNGQTPEGVSVTLSTSLTSDFVTWFSVGNVDFGPESCSDIESGLAAVAGLGEMQPIVSGEFQFFRTFIVADTSPAWSAIVTGSLLSETEAEGTLRVIDLEHTGCDTGVLQWTATASEPTPTPPPDDGFGGGGDEPPTELPDTGSPPPSGTGVPLPVIALATAAILAGGTLIAARAVRRR
ncbi:MAG: hypothetical protein WD379_01390 [Dehalococcoidia bacterium]